MIIKGIFTSEWDFSNDIYTPAELDTETGCVFTEAQNVDGLDLTILSREYFTDENGKEYDICPDCHEGILKMEIVEGVGKHLYETAKCMNQNCESNL